MRTVSVVIPAYNASPWIAETVESVLKQDLPDSEVIVVDDGSTDDTAEMVAAFNGVQYVRKTNGGAASARNAGILRAQGEYVAFVDADDLWLPNKLRLQLELLRSTGLAWVYSDAYVIEGRTGQTLCTFSKLGRLCAGDVLQALFLGDFIPSPTPVIKRAVFDQVGYFDESDILRKREDWDMWLRIAARYPVGLLDRPLAQYRLHSTSSTGRESPLLAFESQRTVIEHAVARDPERLTALKNRALARLHVGAGRTLARNGNLTDARNMFVQAIQRDRRATDAYLYWLGCLLGGPSLSTGIRLRHWLQYGKRDNSRIF